MFFYRAVEGFGGNVFRGCGAELGIRYYGAPEYDNTGEINLGLAREGVFCVVIMPWGGGS